LDNYAENEDQDGGLISNTLELNDAGKDADLPQSIIDFIIHQDITITKNKKKNPLQSPGGAADSSKVSKSMTSNIYHNIYVAFITSEAVIPQDKYYEYRVTRWMYKLAVHPMFNTVVMTIIIMNTIILAFDRYPEPPAGQMEVYNYFNIVFTIIFSIEVIIKLVAFSIRGFIRDRFNIFDALVVLISIIELTVIDSNGNSSLSALRAVRLFRVFKIFRVGDLRVLMDSIGLTVLGMGNYTVLLSLFIYLFALLGMQFFAGKFRFGDDGLYSSSGAVPRENFDTIWEAFITIIIIMIGDNWNGVMYYGMLSEGTFF
jgi:Na+-transporting methylmalonyl-CoA/oxaloacetate decarboxylase gamma subunit